MKAARYLTTEQGDGHHAADADTGHTRRVLQIELDLSQCAPVPFGYAPGDAVGVRCPNREAAVGVVLERYVGVFVYLLVGVMMVTRWPPPLKIVTATIVFKKSMTTDRPTHESTIIYEQAGRGGGT